MKFYISSLCLLFALAQAQHGAPTAATVTVCASCQITTIAEALARAPRGGRIEVAGGTYRESGLTIDKPITLVGKNNPVIDAQGDAGILDIAAPNVTVRGFTLKNSGKDFLQEVAAVATRNAKNCVIDRNTFIDNFMAIYIEASTTCDVTRNTVRGNANSETFSENAIHAWKGIDLWIEGNTVSGHRDGIYFEFVRDSMVLNNHSSRNLRYGLHFMYSNRNTFKGNTFAENKGGVAVMFSEEVVMEGNTFLNHWGSAIYGLLLKDINNSYLWQNTFKRNSVGIYLEGSNRTDIQENRFIQNGYAVRVLGSSMGVMFARNSFLGNSFDVTTNANTSYNAFVNNYWSNYQGYDLDKDGFGDVPYRPVSRFATITERYPSALILLRSPLQQFLDYAERVMPAFTPNAIKDSRPLIRPPEPTPIPTPTPTESSTLGKPRG